MMRRRAGRVVDNFAQVFAKTSGRLHTDINIAVGDAGNQQGLVMIKHRARGFTPGSRHLFLHNGIQFTKPLLILFGRDASRCFFYLFFRKEAPVVGKARRNFIYQLFAAFRQIIHLVPRFLHGTQQQHNAGRGIQSLGAADAVVGRRIIMENDSDPFLCIV